MTQPSSTPRTDAAICEVDGGCSESFEYVTVSFCRQLEKELETAKIELAEAKQQLEHALNPIHSCGEYCQRPACVLRRELTALRNSHEQLRSVAGDVVRASEEFKEACQNYHQNVSQSWMDRDESTKFLETAIAAYHALTKKGEKEV